jgi:hypothetical protein
MAFTGVTPEALMARSDSRNPATTCKGLTKSGRPCRRPIDAKADDGSGGVIAVSSLADGSGSEEDDVGAAAFFCWQHKDQAERLAAKASTGPATQLYPLQERSSIDTLVQRLGVLDVNEPSPDERKKKKNPRLNRPPTWDQVQGPLMSVPSDVMAKRRKENRHSRPAKKKQGFLSRLCCGEADDEDMEAVRRKKRRDHEAQQQQQQHMQMQQPPQTPEPKRPRKTNADYIPSTLSPDLASTLLAALEKPISAHDEPGYIYIFWLTAEDSGPAPSSTASTLLAPPTTRASHSRRTSDVMRQYSVRKSGDSAARSMGGAADKKETILLKIGRANNVTRRMNEWTRQCGYSLSLVRFYPYVSSSAPAPSPGRASASDGVRKVPNVNRVERLVHLELGAQRVLRKCEACGKEHREWFEVEANKDGVKMVDEVIKRWVEWAEAHAD